MKNSDEQIRPAKSDLAYCLVAAAQLDEGILDAYAQALPHAMKTWHGDNMAVFSIDALPRGCRAHVFDTSRTYQCSHMFFGSHVKGFDEYRLLLSDMDSTLISIECIDVLAQYHGCADEVSRLTSEAMANPDVDYRTSLSRRVAMLKGFPAHHLPGIYEKHVIPTPGAGQLVKLARNAGMHTTIVSGGFTYFTERLCGQLDMDGHVGNTLEVVEGALTGRLLGDFVDASFKAETLRRLSSELKLPSADVIALGDGANDLPMMEQAGLAVGYRPKRVIGEYADVVLFDALDLLPDMLRAGKDAVQ